MRLRYRGQDYFAQNYQFATLTLEETGCFRGQSYYLHRPLKICKRPLGLRKYRGVVYSY